MAVNPVTLNLYQLQQADDVARANRMAKAWRFYHGQHPQSLKVRQGQPDDNVKLNFSRAIVDKGVSFLFGGGVEFELDDQQDTPEEQYLDAVWRANRKATLLHKLALNGAVCGHCFVKVAPAQPFPRLVVLDPATVTPTYDDDDIETVTAYRIQYSAMDPVTHKPITRRQLVERASDIAWRITDQVSRDGVSAWQTLGVTIWPHPWPPIVDCQNLPCPNEFWGIADLEDDTLDLNRAINFAMSNLTRIIRYHAHPKTWGKGFNSSQLNIAVDETIVLPSEQATLQNLEMKSDLGSSIQVYHRLREALHEIARIPEVATGVALNLGPLSGVALQVMYQPLVEKTQTKRLTYGDLLTELNRRLLVLGGYGEDHETAIHWPEAVPSDPLAEAQTAVIYDQLGVSQDTLLQRLGFDPEMEAEKRQQQDATSQQMGAQMLQQFEQGKDGPPEQQVPGQQGGSNNGAND